MDVSEIGISGPESVFIEEIRHLTANASAENSASGTAAPNEAKQTASNAPPTLWQRKPDL